jgi:hypothetical protein
MIVIDVGFGGSDATRQQTRLCFQFATQAERNAFIDGVESALGRFEYEVFQEVSREAPSERDA